MPYIKQKDREKFEPELGDLRECMGRIIRYEDMLKGDMTYLAYALGLEFFKGRKSYTSVSTAISCLNDAAEELRRRYLNPYEDKKIEENGDVV